MRKRDFLIGSVGLGVGMAATDVWAQAMNTKSDRRHPQVVIPRRKARTTKMFKAPGLMPNAIQITNDGIWIAQQKPNKFTAAEWGVPQDPDPREAAWLVDWNGKLLKTVMTPSTNTSGMAVGGGYIWMAASVAHSGIYQIDMNGKVISDREVPLSPDPRKGGGVHGMKWRNGKLWIASERLGAALRIDPVTWQAEVVIPVFTSERPRQHDLCFDDKGDMWIITAKNTDNWKTGQTGTAICRYDGKTGVLNLIADFEPGTSDPHGLDFWNGKFISCDAGEHPQWPRYDSPTTGWVFSIEIV